MANKKAAKVGFSEPVETEDEELSDPFATDFFSPAKAYPDADEFEEESFVEADLGEDLAVVTKRSWTADLPQLALADVSQALIFSELPDNLAKSLCEIYVKTISQIILLHSAKADCEIIATAETDFSEELVHLQEEQSVCLSFVVQPQQTEAMLILDSVFAIKIIETALSSEISIDERRELSTTELSVFEFLSLNCLKQFNDFFKEPLFRWRAIEQSATKFAHARGLLSHIRLQIGESTGMVKLLLPPEFLQSLSNSRNPLLARNHKSGKVTQISQIISDVRLHARLGETTINAGELAVIESGDIILIERPAVDFTDSNLTGTVQVRVADETKSSLSGKLSTADRMQLQIREINQTNETKFRKFMMPENQPDNQLTNQNEDLSEERTETEETAEGGLAFEKVIVDVAVELVSRRISLDEIANLRVGQIIELGSRATDPVELVANGRTVAIGELIDIEGSLGVRLTRVLL